MYPRRTVFTQAWDNRWAGFILPWRNANSYPEALHAATTYPGAQFYVSRVSCLRHRWFIPRTLPDGVRSTPDHRRRKHPTGNCKLPGCLCWWIDRSITFKTPSSYTRLPRRDWSRYHHQHLLPNSHQLYRPRFAPWVFLISWLSNNSSSLGPDVFTC